MRKMNLRSLVICIVLSGLILGSGTELKATTYYVATNGDDGNPGTISQPFKTWQKGWNAAQAGDLVYIRGGIYRFTGGVVGAYLVEFSGKSGTSDNPIRIYAYPGEKPVFALNDITVSSGYHYALYLNHVNYVQVKGLRITGFKQPTSGGGGVYGMVLANSNHNLIELCEFDHVGGFPFWIGAGSTDNLVLNCDSHNNADPLSSQPYGGSDGFHIGADAGAINTFRGCRSWWNSDDGWDLFGNGTVVNFENCWAFWNGYYQQTFTTCPGDGIGFKLGANSSTETRILRTLKNCLSFNNTGNGFDQNFDDGSNAHFPIALYNCTAYNNSGTKGGFGFRFGKYNDANILRNNLGFSNRYDYSINAQTISDHNSWNDGHSVSAQDFVSLDTSGITGPRKPDGSLPDLKFLKLATGSDLIDAGANVGISYLGSAPDIGYIEYTTSVISIPISGIVVSGANGVKTISTDHGTLQLSAAISPTNATNKSVAWSIQNGTGQASISSSGLITALSNGTVTARATAMDGSGVYGTLGLTISNQTAPTGNSIVRSDGCSIITARSGYLSREIPNMAFDNYTSTKWYNYNVSGNIWIQYQFCNGASYIINSYTLTSANDMPLRDPKTVSISGSNDGVNFTLLDTKTNITFSSRFQKQTFSFTNTKAYQYYRFDMAANPGNDGLQVSEIELIETGATLKSTQMVEFSEGMVTVSPNPFREALTIDYNLPGDTHVNLVVYDLNGRMIRQLVNENQTEGSHRIVWDALNSSGNNLHNGIYILKMESAFGSEISKIIYSE